MASIPQAVTKVTEQVTRAANTAVDTAKAARSQAKNAVSRAKDTANKVRNKLKRSKCGQPNSFTAGTQVVLASGLTVPIEQLQPGDAVLATDPQTGRTESRQVTAAIEGSGSKQLIDLTLVGAGAGGGSPGSSSTDEGDRVTATAGHPFWTARGWVEASDLKVGDRLRDTGGATVDVAATSSRTEQATVYNLTVDTDHTYYIRTTNGTTALTHNTNLRATNGGALDINECPIEVVAKSATEPARTLTEKGLNHSFDRHAAQWFGRDVSKADKMGEWAGLIGRTAQSRKVVPWSSGGTLTSAHLARIEGKWFAAQFDRSTGELVTAFVPNRSQRRAMLRLLGK